MAERDRRLRWSSNDGQQLADACQRLASAATRSGWLVCASALLLTSGASWLSPALAWLAAQLVVGVAAVDRCPHHRAASSPPPSHSLLFFRFEPPHPRSAAAFHNLLFPLFRPLFTP